MDCSLGSAASAHGKVACFVTKPGPPMATKPGCVNGPQNPHRACASLPARQCGAWPPQRRSRREGTSVQRDGVPQRPVRVGELEEPKACSRAGHPQHCARVASYRPRSCDTRVAGSLSKASPRSRSKHEFEPDRLPTYPTAATGNAPSFRMCSRLTAFVSSRP